MQVQILIILLKELQTKSYKKDTIKPSVNLFMPTMTQQNNPISYSIFYVDDLKNINVSNFQYNVIQNDKTAQIVSLDNNQSFYGTVFSANQSFKIPTIKKSISTNTPILFMYKNKTIFVTEPTLQSSTVVLKIKRKTYNIKLDEKGQGYIKI